MNEAGAEQLRQVADSAAPWHPVGSEAVPARLPEFGAKRRRYVIVEPIRDALEGADPTSDPDFKSAYINSLVQPGLVANADGVVGEDI